MFFKMLVKHGTCWIRCTCSLLLYVMYKLKAIFSSLFNIMFACLSIIHFFLCFVRHWHTCNNIQERGTRTNTNDTTQSLCTFKMILLFLYRFIIVTLFAIQVLPCVLTYIWICLKNWILTLQTQIEAAFVMCCT